MKLREGNVFIGVYQSFVRRGEYVQGMSILKGEGVNILEGEGGGYVWETGKWVCY